MTIRGLLFLSGLTMIVLGLSFLLFPEFISKNIFQEANENEIKIATIHRQLMGGGSLFIGILLLLAHRNVTSAAKRILFGTSLGFYILTLIQIKLMIFDENNIFWPVFLIFLILGTLSLYVSYYKKH
ncbi:MAG: hypothetical protein CMN37_07570 [SAR116 cluster bacterium]|nr:hypothetical protein [SAR116 cluster bacterium]